MQQITLHPRIYAGEIDFKELAHIIMIEGADRSSVFRVSWRAGI